MFNTFPDLLVYTFFAPLLLRVSVAMLFFYLAYNALVHRRAVANLSFPIIGGGGWAPWVAVVVYGAIATSLLLGIYTQIAALLGISALLKVHFFERAYPVLAPISRGTRFFAIVVLCTLLLTGAGALAFDLPL